MIFEEARLKGAFVIRPEKREDSRGFFARTWCKREFDEQGLVSDLSQISVSRTRRRGTLRGLHYQIPPAPETKVVRCTRGTLYDVIVDLRPSSVTYGQWLGVELSADDHVMLYVPEGFAHGFQTLTEDVEILYQISGFYSPEHARGVRYDDPSFGIRWPQAVSVISEKDRSWPDYSPGPALRDID